MKPEAVIFDLDGTLVDTLDDLTSAVNHALASAGLPASTRTAVRANTGNGIRRLIAGSCPEGTEEKVELAVFEEFKRRYAEHDLDETAPYPGIVELLDALEAAGMRMAVVSNKADFAAQRIVEALLPGRFGAVLGERAPYARKPAPDMVDAVLAALGATREQAVYVGDSEVDAATAAACGIPCILCSWGFRDRDRLSSLEHIAVVDTPGELIGAILG